MAPHSLLKAYRDVQVESVAHGGRGAELVVTLYESVCQSLIQAKLHQERREFLECGRQSTRAMTIIAGLRDTLDFEQGEPVASNLLKFYNAVLSKILAAQTRNDPLLLQEASDLVQSVSEAWSQLAFPERKPLVPAATPGHVETSRSSAAVPSGAGVAAAV